ncbi:MAG: hypothetical protein HQL56_13060 [Magnetococcales bacterium]|nr:hypothetical protein [Magnetococcales bacterium]
MTTVELKASIVDHRVNVVSDRLPSHRGECRVIVLFDEEKAPYSPKEDSVVPMAELLAESFPPQGDGLPMKREEIYDRPGLR